MSEPEAEAESAESMSHGDVGTMRRVAIVMFMFGGVVCFSGVWITQTTPGSKLAQGVISAMFLVTGLAVVALPARRRFLEAIALWSIVLISCLIAVTEQMGMAPNFLLWPVVYAAYFSARRVAIVAFAWMTLTLALGLALNSNHDLKIDTWVGSTATVGLMAALISTMTQREALLHEELAVAAETDPLTGLMNRRSFDPRLGMHVDKSAIRGRPLSVVMFDLDHFKQVNDDHGHLVGDRVLQAVAEVLRSQSRDGDLVARFGGEEFAVALPGANVSRAKAYTERVAASLAAMESIADLNLTTSAGIASLVDGVDSADRLMEQADEALYAAKAGGRCRHAYWDDGLTIGPRFGETTPV